MPGRVPTLYDGEEERPLPWRWEICSACDGHGKSSAYLGAFSGRALEDAQADSEWWEDYVNGRYDRACEHCDGGRVRVVDRAQMKPADLRKWDAQVAEDASDAATSRMERLMEGGWREEGWFDD